MVRGRTFYLDSFDITRELKAFLTDLAFAFRTGASAKVEYETETLTRPTIVGCVQFPDSLDTQKLTVVDSGELLSRCVLMLWLEFSLSLCLHSVGSSAESKIRVEAKQSPQVNFTLPTVRWL